MFGSLNFLFYICIWKKIEDIIKRTFIDMANVDVFVYDLKDDGITEYSN